MRVYSASLLWRTHCRQALGMFVQRKYERDNATQAYLQRKNERDNMVTLRWRGNVSLSVE